MFEEETMYENLTQELAYLRDAIYQLSQEAKRIERYQPDAAEDALEKAETAMEHYEEAQEIVADCRQNLSNFLDQANIAAQMYDHAQSNPNSNEIAREAEKEKNSAEKLRTKVDRNLNKLSGRIEKVKLSVERATAKINVAQIKAKTQEERNRNKKVRINFTLPEHMKDDWKDLSEELGISVSEMIRDAMGEFKEGIKSLEGLDKDLGKMGEKIGKFGSKIGKYVNEEVERNLGANPYMRHSAPQPPVDNPYASRSTSFTSGSGRSGFQSRVSIQEKEKMKKRITGLIRIQNALPIDKLAQALSFSPEDAENLIYELAAEGIEGKLEGGIFKYKNKAEDVIEKVHEFIERM
ncbi:MAG: hypothetical protein ACTSVZ_10045 [Promethearchaeota archaeon]